MAYYAGQKLRASDLGQSTTCAEYNNSASQTIGTGSDTKVAFGTTNTTSTLVTRTVDGVGHSFTVNDDGIWAITTTMFWGAVATGERWTRITVNGSPMHSAAQQAPGALFIVENVTLIRPLSNGDLVHVIVFQNSGGNRDIGSDNTNGLGRINLCWLGG